MNCRALIGYSRQISELPQEQSDEDAAEKFALEDPPPRIDKQRERRI